MNMTAVDNMTISIKRADITEDTLTLYTGVDVPDPMTEIDYTVTVNEEVLPVDGIKTAAEGGEGTSYLLLTDVSGSMRRQDMEEARTALKTIVGNLTAQDNVCLMRMGNDVSAVAFTEAFSTVLDEIDGLEATSEDTNLYYAVNKALDVLSDSHDAHEDKCLVIISDGMDDQLSGITREEVNDRIDQKRITICTIAPSSCIGKADTEESAKILGSFARRSPGGKHFLIGQDGRSATQAGADVLNTTRNALVITADIGGYYTDAQELTIGVNATSDAYGTSSDALKVTTPKSMHPVAVTEASGKTDVTRSTNSPAGLLGGLLIAALVVLVVLWMLRRRGTQKTEAVAQETPDEKPAKQKTEMAMTVAEEKPQEGMKAPAIREYSVCNVTLYRIGKKQTLVLQGTCRTDLTIGRTAGKADLVIADDARLSGTHCRLSYSDTMLKIEDMGSTNGTRVNGVPVRTCTRVQDGDRIEIGGHAYRITLQEQTCRERMEEQQDTDDLRISHKNAQWYAMRKLEEDVMIPPHTEIKLQKSTANYRSA